MHGVIGDEIAIGSGLPERRNRQENQRRVRAMERLPSEPEPRDLARRETLDDDIGGARERSAMSRAARMREVERQRSFVEIVEPEKQAAIVMRQVIVEGADAACVVAGGRLDLDDIGTHVGEQPRAQMRAMRAEIEHAQPRERAGSWLGHGFSVELRRGEGPSISLELFLDLGRWQILDCERAGV